MVSPLLVLQDAVLAAGTALRMALQDPVHFAVQFVRRTAPSSVRKREPAAKRPSQWRALRWFLMDRPDQARQDLRAIGNRGRIAAELAAHLGTAEPGQLRGAPAARAWLARGELTKALGALPNRHALARRVASELRVYSPGFELPVEPWTLPKHGGDRPRVLFILTNSLPYTQSGYTARTHSILKELVTQGIDVLAVTRIGYPVTVGRLGNSLRNVIDGVEYRRLPAWSLPVPLDQRLAAQVKALQPIVERFRPDALHTTTDLTNAVVTRALAKTYSLPWVYELRGQLELSWVASRPEELQEVAQRSERVRLWRAKDAELASAADKVIVLSGVQRAELHERGIRTGKTLVVPNCVDEAVLSRLAISPADARERLGLPREGRWIGSVTSMLDYEGLDTLLDAVAIARNRGHDLRIAIVGDGVSRPQILAQARKLGFTSDVAVFPGRVSGAEALEWYEALDVFAVPRKDTPVCRIVTPLKPLTAMALGRAVVVRDLPALAAIAERSPELTTIVKGPAAEEWASALILVESRPSHGLDRGGLSWQEPIRDLGAWYSSVREASDCR